jgi:2-C-methyl-D-erythritol 4-phosphate cytidylyltransferase
MKVTALVPAAGTGSRMAREVPKQFLTLGGLPIVVHALKTIEAAPEIQETFLIVPPGLEDRCRKEWLEPFGLKKVTRLLPGGLRRQDSVYAGLLATSSDTDIVLVHDGVRPFVTRAMIRQTIEGAVRHNGALVAVAVKDTPKMADTHGQITASLDRSSLWLAQTPQAFSRSVLIEAYQRAYTDGVYHTDDAALVERLGYRVQIIPGAWYNLKITQPEDLLLAEEILKMRQESLVED